MGRMVAMLFFILSTGFVLGLVRANIVLHENGYEGVVVVIGEKVPEDPNIIENLKLMFEDGSRVLDEATHHRAHFREVTIVVPSTWTHKEEYMNTSGSGWMKHADVRVDEPHPVHGDAPYTLQLGGCGDPGAYIHLSPGYATAMYHHLQSVYGPPGKVLVHEWSHLRWGVFDEYGEHDTHTPPFYIGEDRQVHVTGCSADIKGWLMTKNGSECHADHSGMPNRQCHFFPAPRNNATASFMNLYFLDSVTMFCDNNTHNSFAPNTHNLQCDGRSVWDVISQHQDFKDNMLNGTLKPWTSSSYRNPPQEKQPHPQVLTPRFQVIQEAALEKPRFVLLLDLSGSMDQYMNQFYQAVVRFVRNLAPTGSLMSVVSFANTSRLDLNFTVVPEDRDDIVASLPKTYTVGGYTAIGGALEFVLQLVEETGIEGKGLMVVLITDGEETIHPKVETKLPAVKRKGIIINTVSFGPNATDCLEFWAKETGGRSYYHSTGSSGSLSSLDALLFDAITKDDDRQIDQLLQVYRMTHNITAGRNHFQVGEVVLDSSLGHETRFTFTETFFPHIPFSISVTLRAPDGQEYDAGSNSRIYHADNTTRTITFNILEAMPGRWEYNIRFRFSTPNEVQVAVTSHPSRKTRQVPIRVKAWMPASNITYPEPALVYAYISQGYSTVLDATVTAVIVPPTEDGPITFSLLDNGVGADTRAKDGIYSAYFTQFSANGRYSLSATVSTSNRTVKLQGYSTDRGEDHLRVPGSSAIRRLSFPEEEKMLSDPRSKFPPDELVPSEDGGRSKDGADDLDRTVNRLQKVEPFTRFTSGGIFKVNNFHPGDQQPPGRVTDLVVSSVYLYDASVTLAWTSPGDDLYTGTASSLELRYHKTMKIHHNFKLGYPVNSSLLTYGDLTPKPAGDLHTIILTIPGETAENLEGRAIFFALRARDESGNSGDLSNIATAYFPYKKYTRNIKEEQKMDAISGLVVLVVLAAIIIIIVAFIASVKFLHVRKRKQRKEQQLVEAGNRYCG
ncbi:calcium-activated chloride channel regulator 1-like isoform X1 [Homarus americanus]|uniref:calcium-activated chloride channel regulator 1-like isoform X1 n=1 Tax=Homarus americanus TaxID=6706 RepID=UPI001C487C63|nr:calcium-activated chloride channel regulator 1-like isoform X1 [Homarus americanus]